MADVEYIGQQTTHQNNNEGQGRVSSAPARSISAASSQLSFSDHIGDEGGGDADEDNSSFAHHHCSNPNPGGSSTCSSSFNLHRQSSIGSQPEGERGSQSQNADNVPTNAASTANKILNVVNGSCVVGDVNSHPAKTSTISTIAMESNTSATSKCSPTRLVIALLQTPHQALQLKIIELSPNLLKLPDNLPDAEDYLKNHSQVIKNLQSKQSPVEELLRQADKLLATQKPRAEVYAAMADSLGQTWKDLNGILDERRILIDLAYNCHKVIQSCVDRMNELHSAYSKFNYIPTIEEQYVQGGTPQDVAASLRQLKEDRADVLKRVSQALDACQQLLNKITHFNFSIDSRQLFLKRDVDFATKQVHRWLERLHDRRMILEDRLKMKREQFEEMADFLIHDREMSGLLQELDRLLRAYQEFSLGHSVQSSETQRDALENMVREMKVLQERALLTARKLETDSQPSSLGGETKGKFYQRFGLKQKIYEILGTVNDLITESIDFELSLVDAKEFFHLAELANGKLDELASTSSSTSTEERTGILPKSQINSLTVDALSKGQNLLDSLGWDSPRTRGVRGVYDNLNKRKAVIQDEIEHLELLDEYNHFLEKVNQAYQNIVNVETSTVRQPKTLPVDLLLVSKFREEQEQSMEELSDKTNFKELLSKLEQIYPGLTEQEKISTETKVNQLKSLSNVLVEVLLQRIWLAGEWHKILELDRNEWSILTASPHGSGKEVSKRIHDVKENIVTLYTPIQQQLNEIHRADPDLITSKLEQKMEEILAKYQSREAELAAAYRIRDICQAYKLKLDRHLLGNTVPIEDTSESGYLPVTSSVEPSYFPVLEESLVATTLCSEGKPSVALGRIVGEQLQAKLNSTLHNFFQPLITNFRREILKAQEDLVGCQLAEKSAEEISWERYFERLKESYVKVTTELEGYLSHMEKVCRQVEEIVVSGETVEVNVTIGSPVSTSSVENIERELNRITEFRREFERGMDQDLKGRLDKVLSIIGHEEPPIQAEKEERTLRTLTASIIQDQLDSSISQKQDTLTRQLTEKMIHNDLDMINRTLNELISELEHPCNYGNNLRDAQTYLASFERFEKTVETLRDKLSRLLTTAGMSETDVKAQNLLGKLNLLVDRKGKRRELILLSLDYFRLIEKSYEHYDQVNKKIDEIIGKSKQPNIEIGDIEGLLKQLDSLKGKEGEQEKRLTEIERISKIIFDVSQEAETRQHYPLRDQNTKMSGEIIRVESDLTSLLEIIRSQSAPVIVPARVPSPLELDLESQIVVETKPKVLSGKVSLDQSAPLPPPPVQKEEKSVQFGEEVEVIEDLIVPTRVVRPKSQEMCTQTSMMMDEDELEAKTREYLKEKERMTMAVLDVLRQSMSPLPPPPPQTVEKETQFEDMEEAPRTKEKVDRDTLTQTIDERRRSFETQTEELPIKKGVEISTDTEEIEYSLVEATTLFQQQQRPPSRESFHPVMFIEPLKDIIVNEGEKVVLECKTTGQIQQLVWLKDGLEITNNPDYKTDFLDGSTARLTVDEVLAEDSAIFTCRAFRFGEGESNNIMVETSGRLTIREPVTSVLVAPQFLAHSPVSIGEHGKAHIIQVKVEGNPLPTVQWFKDGQCIDTSPDYIITFNNGVCEVQFDELVKDMDDGIYTCVGTNKMGDCETTVEMKITGDVDVSKKLSRLPPRITKPLPKNLMSRAGQKVKLECEFESHTDSTVVWLKDDNKILTKTNSSAEITTQGTSSTLIFNEAYPVISGKYTILVRNAGGECQSDCQIIVKGLLPAETSDSELNISDSETVKPAVKMPLKDVRGRVGDSLVLDCVIVGNPEPEVIWYKNAVPLKESPNHHLLFHGDKCSLVIAHAEHSDNGIYSVSALNNCGEASSKCQVFVFERSPETSESKPVQPPAFAKMIQDEMVTAGSPFSYVVQLKPDPENPDVVIDVTWWKNNSQIPSGPGRVEITKDGLQHLLHFKEVDLIDKGNYMVKAVNSGGDSKCFGNLIVKENFERPDQVAPKEPEQKLSAPPSPKQTEALSHPSQLKTVTIAPKPVVKPPRFVIPLEGKMVDEGDKNVSLKCKVAACPPATVKWTKNNSTEPLESSESITLSYNERNGEVELSFSTVNVKDGGRYTCQATNEHGIATSLSDLVVKKTNFPPVFSKRLQSTTLEEGKRIYLEIDVFGKPSPEVYWFINGAPIIKNETEGITLKSDSPTRHSIIIASGKRDKHSGEYKVIARNGAGEASCSCTVNLVGKMESLSTTGTAEAAFIPIQSKIVQQVSSPVIPKVTESLKMESSSRNLSTTNVEKSNAQIENLVESSTTTTTIYTSKEEHTYQTRVTEVISPIPHADIDSLTVRPKPELQATPRPTEILQEATTTAISKTKEDLLVPGPEPEILMAPTLPSGWTQSKNQVLRKVKKFEEENAEAAASPPVEGPPGGVRIIPIHKADASPTPPPHSTTTILPFKPVFPLTEPQHHQRIESMNFGETLKTEPILPLSSSSPFEGYLLEQPKTSYDASSMVSKDAYKIGDTFVQKEEQFKSESSSSQVKYIKPSKFVPEKMRESDHDSEVESTVIPTKWIPPITLTIPVSTQSAFVPISSAFVSSQTATSSTFSQQQQHQQYISPMQIPSQKPINVRPETIGVKSIAKQWPPQGSTTDSTEIGTSSTSSLTVKALKTEVLSPVVAGGTAVNRLSPILFAPPDNRSARSPTPNKEALEMDRLWARPIKFSSPVTVPQTSIPGQSSTGVVFTASPTSTMKKVKPEVPPKPSASWLKRTTPTPYSPVASPLPPQSSSPFKPEVPPKPSYLKSASPYSPQPSPLPTSRPVSATPAGDASGTKDALYYVSTVSTPRTTPIPPQLLTGWTSPLPSTPELPAEQSYSSSFHEKREFFESSTMDSSYHSTDEMSTSSQKQFSTTNKALSESGSTRHPPSATGITSPTFMDFHPSGISLLDQSFLPPPGEPPVFMYAPPPAISSTPQPKSTSQSFSSSSSTKSTFMQMQSSSSSSSGTTTTIIPSSLPSSSNNSKEQVEVRRQFPEKVYSDHHHQQQSKLSSSPKKVVFAAQPQLSPEKVTKPMVIISNMDDELKEVEREMYTATVTSATTATQSKDVAFDSTTMTKDDHQSQYEVALVPFTRKQHVPYIRPTKFIPVLDYFSSGGEKETRQSLEEGAIHSKWKPGEMEQHCQQQMSTWRKVTYEPSTRDSSKARRDSLGSLVDKNMQELNKQFKANISQLSQGLCYNRMDRNIQSDLSGLHLKDTKEAGEKEEGVIKIEASKNVEDANPLIYFKYDFGYEFGIATPRNTRSFSEPPANSLPSTSNNASSRPTSWMPSANHTDDDAPIILPIIHETTTNKNDSQS